MLKILVAEDEPLLLRGICKIIRSIDDNYEIVSACSNGQEAIQFIEQFPNGVDVIITDLYMPKITGLELLDYVRNSKFSIEVVLLTGYQDFQYVQHALQQKAFDYVLKPVRKASLVKLLDRLYKHTSLQRQDDFQQSLTDILYFNQSSQGKTLEDYLVSSTSEAGQYYIFYFCAGSYPTSTALYKGEDTSCSLLFNSVQQNMQDKKFWLLKHNIPRERLGLLYAKNTHDALAVANFLYYTYRHNPIPVSIILSSPIYKWENLYKEHQSIRKFAANRMVYSKSTFFIKDSKHKSSSTNEYAIPSHIKNKLLYGVENDLFAEISEGISTIFSGLQDTEATQYNIENLLIQIAYWVYQSIPDPGFLFSDTASSITDMLSSHYNYDSLYHDYLTLIQNILLAKQSRQNTAPLAKQIKQYIEQNMAENLSTHTLSRKFNITSSYLAKLFKDYCGYTPVKYIMKLRIEKAKSLLVSNSQAKTKDIASVVGYTDALYFSRIFKKETGVSPSEYRTFILETKSKK